ncbi:MAG: hypothetical protein JXQ29_09280 [Planctomycetes bacterium]|nr:hypothetical protein [Planctomycetota bacterium]
MFPTERIRLASGLLALAAVLVACNSHEDHDGGDPAALNRVLDGDYFYVEFARAVSPSSVPDLAARAGLATADGQGRLEFGPAVGTPPPVPQRSYQVDSLRRIDGATPLPGATFGGGDAFALVDLDRGGLGEIGLEFFTRAGQNMTVASLVDSPTTSTRYHAVHYVFNRPGVDSGFGTAELVRASDTTGGWKIDVALASASTLSRYGTLELSPYGNLVAADLTTGRSYVGVAEPHGDWIVWIETDTSGGRAVRMDVLVRQGAGLSDANLNGGFNLVGFLEAHGTGEVDTAFGEIRFDGRGRYYALKWRNSRGQSIPPSPVYEPYSVTPAGVVRLEGSIGATGCVTRSPDRRWLVFPQAAPSGTVAIFFALKR